MAQIAIRSLFLNTENRLCAPLAALGREAPQAASRFRRWVGISGRSYLVSVYPIDQCPDYVDAVVIAVEGGACVWIGESGQGGEALAATLRIAAEAGASEVHVHLLAGGSDERAAAIRDLDGRH
jgi:hypothetical protein